MTDSSMKTEWDRLWQIVRDTPDDFNSWEQLIRVAEAPEGGLTKTSPPESIARLESVYDSFLAKFPLCFGYWKKYSDWELALHGDESAEKIFERGVAAIHNSIDLWNQYLDFKMSHSSTNDDIESLMERAASSVGLDFLGHPFWDKYLEFAETRLANPKRVLELLDRIVVIPMHQYARYYEKWRGLRNSMKPTEALDSMTLEVFTNEIRNSSETKDFEVALKEKMDAQTAAVYKRTQEGTNKRWVYEAEIKRSYFHVKPLDRPQLENWSKYLDFEESQNDISRIRALYERCLVPCAQYEDFWLRYGQWLTKNDLLTDVKHAYERAAYIFLHRDRCTVKVSLALILEEEGKIDEARKIFTTVLDSMPSHVETILHHIHFERRQDPSQFESLVNSYINSDQLSISAKAFFTIQYTKYLQQNNQVDKAREVYSISANLYPQNKLFWINYLNFELGFYDASSFDRINQVFGKALKSLPTELQSAIKTQYRDFLLERGNSIDALNRNPATVSTDFSIGPTSNISRNGGLKRPAVEDNSFGYTKQARFDGPVQPQQQQSYGTYPRQQSYAGSDYYSQLQQQQQQPWQS